MKIACTPLILEKEALEARLNKKGFFNPGRLFTGGRPVSKIELKYVEYLILDYEMKLGNGRKSEFQQIRLIGNGSTGSVSFLETIPPVRTQEIPAEMIQHKDYEANDMKRDAARLAGVICRKLTGKRCWELELKDASSIYRPFWAVYYGEPRKDGKILCRPYGADGFTIKQ